MGILTLLRIFLGVDMALGLFNYATWTWLFAQPFNISFLCLSLLSTHLPDADMIPYLMFRKRYRLISHWIFAHHPLLLLPLVALVSFIAAKIYAPAAVGYTVTLITTGVFLHFAHDGMHIHGFPWFSPFSLARFRFRDGKFSAVPQNELNEWHERVLRWKQKDPSTADEISVRATPINWARFFLWVAASITVVVFFLQTPHERKLSDINFDNDPTKGDVAAIWGPPDDYTGLSNEFSVYQLPREEIWIEFDPGPSHHLAGIRSMPAVSQVAHANGRRKLNDLNFKATLTYQQVTAVWGRPDSFAGFGIDYYVYWLNDGQVVWMQFGPNKQLLGATLWNSQTHQRKPLL